MSPDVVVVIPCYNEARRLDEAAFAEAVRSSPHLNLLFVDDGSTDATGEILHAIARNLGDRAGTLRLQANAGKAEAVRIGMLAAINGTFNVDDVMAVGYWDADLAAPLRDVDRFRAVLTRQPETVAVVGSRVRLMGRRIDRRATRHYAGRVFATLASVALGFPVYDTQCGAKLFRVDDDLRVLLTREFTTHWAFDVEVLARLAARHGSDLGDRRIVVEYPLEHWSDVEGSKVRLAALPRMIADLLRIRRIYHPEAPAHQASSRQPTLWDSRFIQSPAEVCSRRSEGNRGRTDS